VRPWQPGKPPFKLIPSLFSLESMGKFNTENYILSLASNFVDGDTIRVNVSKKAGWCLVNK